MDKNISKQMAAFLALDAPSDEQIRDAALILLRISPNTERGIYNSAMKRPQELLPWVRADIKKYYDIRQRGLETAEVEEYNQKTVALVEESLAKTPDVLVGEAGQVPELNIRGKREDHDSLPEEIRQLWDKNAERWKKMRKLHAQLLVMISKPGYKACDGNELCYQLRQADIDLRNDYRRYDEYVAAEDGKGKESASSDSVEVFADNVKTVQNARTAMSRGLDIENPNDEQRKKVQDAVNTLCGLGQKISEKTIERLRAAGYAIPEQ